jgi:AP-3 complex subunit delta-1
MIPIQVSRLAGALLFLIIFAAVVAAAVNVFCELARRNPKDYLSLAPQLFHLLTTSSNNWMLIKIIKLVRTPRFKFHISKFYFFQFGSLSPHEPRLVKKLQSPITELISTTPAISLLYECVHTCIIGGMLEGPSGDSLAKICVSKLAAFIQDADQNCEFVSLNSH